MSKKKYRSTCATFKCSGMFVRVHRQAHAGHVLPAEDSHRRGAPLGFVPRPSTFAVEEALHVRQEGDELVVVALLELGGVAGELVDHFVPRIALALSLEQFPVLLDLRALANRHQLQRPEQDLPEMPDPLLRPVVLLGHPGLRRRDRAGEV